jgi:hypothetical protein
LKKQGIIEKVDGLTPYVSPFVCGYVAAKQSYQTGATPNQYITLSPHAHMLWN